MSKTSPTNKKFALSKETKLLLQGLLVGKVLTLLVIGGLLWWLKPHFGRFGAAVADVAAPNPTTQDSTFDTLRGVPIGTFNYGGSTAWAPIRLLVDSQIQSARPEMQLHYVNPAKGYPSSSSGIQMLLNGKLDFAQSSRPLTVAEYTKAQQHGLKLQQIAIATEAVAVVVNPSLAVSGITTGQLQQIYLGQITNWQQVGGPNLPITLFARRPQDTDTTITTNNQLPQPGVVPHLQYVQSTTEAVRLLSHTPGGVYVGAASEVVPQCSVKPLALGHTLDQLIPPYREPLVSAQACPRQRNEVNTAAIAKGSYPITQNLYVVLPQNHGQEQQAGEAYAKLLMTDQGEKALQQAGFVPIR